LSWPPEEFQRIKNTNAALLAILTELLDFNKKVFGNTEWIKQYEDRIREVTK
jgi:hypothetical protein